MRSKETNSANFITDLVRTHFDQACDLFLLNSGTLRSNQIITRGDITIRTIQDLIPYPDKVVLLKVRGDLLKSLLENAVSAFPALEGKFCSISGFAFSFDPEQPVGDRIHSVKNLNGEPMDLS